jgi:hypothetical protein
MLYSESIHTEERTVERIRFIQHNGKEILFLNFANCDAAEAHAIIDPAKALICARPQGSLLTLTDVTNARFDDTLNERIKAFTAHNKPYVKAAAVVGVTGLKKILFEATMLFSRRKLHAFETLDQAKAWLTSTP